MEIENKNKIGESVDNLFERTGGSDDMWKVASKFALQLTQNQIYALTHLNYFARIAKPEVADRLNAFVADYLKYQNNRNTGLFIAKMAEFESLRKYFTGIQGQVKIEK